MKKLVSLLTVLAMLLAVVPAIGVAETAEPIVISAFVTGDPEIDYSENYVIKMLEEETGVRLDVSEFLVASADAATQKQLALAGGDYPDIFLTEFKYNELYNYGTIDGTLVPLNEYLTTRLSEYPTLEMLYTARPEYYNMFKDPNGDVYSMAIFSECGHCRVPYKAYINTDWVNKLGMSVPTTLDELYNYLVAVKNTDLNENGVADEIPLTGSGANFVSYIANAFLPIEINAGRKYTSIQNGVASFGASTEQYREALRFMKKLYDEGLLDVAAFTQDSSQLSQTVSGETPLAGMFTGAIYGIDMTNTYAYNNFRMMMPIKTADGHQYTDNRSIADMNTSGMFSMTDVCENPDAAIKFMDRLMDFDTYMIRVYGLENEGWVRAEEGQTNVLGGEYIYQFNHPSLEGVVKTENTTFHGGPWGALIEFRALWSNLWGDDVLYTDSKVFESRIELETEEQSQYFIETAPSTFFFDGDETSEYSELLTNIGEYTKLATAEFITGVRDIETGWDAYLADLDRFNVDRFVELYQKGYDNTYAAE